MNDMSVGYDWRQEPSVRVRRDVQKRQLELSVRFEVYAHDGDEWDKAEQVAEQVKELLAKQAGSLAAYGVEVHIAVVE